MDGHQHPEPVVNRLTECDTLYRTAKPLDDLDAYERADLISVTVTDANGDPVARGLATVDITDDPADRLRVRFRTLALGGRELLPVRTQPQPPTVAVAQQPHSDGPLLGTVSPVTHSHPHHHTGVHPGGQSYAECHAHPHTHAGDDALRANTFGHDDAPHVHEH